MDEELVLKVGPGHPLQVDLNRRQYWARRRKLDTHKGSQRSLEPVSKSTVVDWGEVPTIASVSKVKEDTVNEPTHWKEDRNTLDRKDVVSTQDI